MSFFITSCLISVDKEELPQSTHPVWSPTGDRLAFINNRVGVDHNNPINFEVYVMESNGDTVKRLTFNEAFEADLSWSPDGTRLACKSYRDGNDEVYVIDVETGEQVNISNHPEYDGCPLWYGNGSIIFQSKRDHVHGELYTYDLKRGSIIRLTDNEFTENSANISPDSSKLVFTSNMDGDDDLYIMEFDSDSIYQITDNELNDWYPRWSPDGKSIVFTYGDWEEDIWELRIISHQGMGERTLISNVDSGNCSWHPNGESIAFGSGRNGAGEIFIFDLRTSSIVMVNNNLSDQK